jgi:predicted O-linked N-acetylglucosamine transferase (SPINDLY family)
VRIAGARGCALDAASLASQWDAAVRAHQQRDFDGALAGYARVLDAMPEHAAALFLAGAAHRDAGRLGEARALFRAAIDAAPAYVDARVAAVSAATAAGDAEEAVLLCLRGLERAPSNVALWRALGHAQLANRDGGAAAAAFERALAIEPTDGDTHYNQGVALQMAGRLAEAARAYQRALAFRPELIDADFNLGVIFQQQGTHDAAIAAYENVIARDPARVAAYKNLGELLFDAGRIDRWIANFRRFEASCPQALPLAVQALEVCQYAADFAGVERYLEGLRNQAFHAANETELADALEQVLYLLLYFDVEPEMLLKFAQTYDATARHVYGGPLPRPASRRPGPLRIGYLSADVRDHVMGKMAWSAIEHHDRGRFELYIYSLSAQQDDWTARFRGIAHRFDVVAGMHERDAARRIADDDLDVLVDLSTHTKGARPGILALKPARVQITHVASAGTLGLSTVDFKLTDRYADVPENAAYQIEPLLPIDGCVYPYRHIEPAPAHPFSREALGISRDAIVIGAFVSGLKLSRRCLSLWRDVLARVPRAMLAFSPVKPALRALYQQLAAAGGIGADRLLFVPQGRTDGENQARYSIVDFVLDPMPYGGVNGVLEPLDAGVPVVTLVGKRHAERSAYSILANLGVTDTIAASGRDYVDLAARLAGDAAFMRDVRAKIGAGLARSALTDRVAHTRALERAYVAALAAKAPEALAAAERT